MFCIPDLFSISKAIVSLSCLITKYSVVWWYRWHRCVVGSNLMRHHNGEFSYWGHWISVAWSHISLNLLNKEKLILCSIFLTFVIKALYCSCRWLAFEECLVNADNRKALFLRWELRLINGWKDGRRLCFYSSCRLIRRRWLIWLLLGRGGGCSSGHPGVTSTWSRSSPFSKASEQGWQRSWVVADDVWVSFRWKADPAALPHEHFVFKQTIYSDFALLRFSCAWISVQLH